jgi:hypothetical protein
MQGQKQIYSNYNHTVGFYGGKSHENHFFRLYFLKISFCNLFKVVYHRLIPHLVKIATSNVVFYTPFKKHHQDEW